MPLRVVLFTECYRPIQNGVVASVDALAEGLRERGHDVLCITPTMPGYREAETSVVRLPSLPLPTPTAYRLTLPLLSARHFAHGAQRPSIVHAHSPFVTGWMAVRTARRYGVPLVFTYHTQLEAYAHYVPFEAQLTRRAAALLTRSYANAADAVIVPTHTMERRLRSIGVNSRITVVPSGFDVAFFARGRRRDDLRARFGAGPDERLILCVGRLGREKNLELALHAFATLAAPRTKLAIVGDGPHRLRLEAAAVAAGIAARTHFAGELPREALPDAYASADAFLFTSRSETQGLVLAEALATGLPVVALDTPQTREVLAGEGTVAAGDPHALAAALRGALDRPRPAPAPHVAARFERHAVTAQTLDLYAELLAAKIPRAV